MEPLEVAGREVRMESRETRVSEGFQAEREYPGPEVHSEILVLLVYLVLPVTLDPRVVRGRVVMSVPPEAQEVQVRLE